MIEQLSKSRKIFLKPLPVPSWAAWGTFIFFLIGLFAAMPCMCREGVIIAQYSSILYIIVLARLPYGILRRNLKKQDFALWVGAFIVFRIIAGCLH
ncbi:MAG: hypothetical protein JXA96_12515 [Sedimentisphaerales bacterium]|nr:hypothetical protein [Sedimentisphaerales bacterium]